MCLDELKLKVRKLIFIRRHRNTGWSSLGSSLEYIYIYMNFSLEYWLWEQLSWWGQMIFFLVVPAACSLLVANPVLLWVSDSGLGERTDEEDQSNPPYINNRTNGLLPEEIKGGPQKKDAYICIHHIYSGWGRTRDKLPDVRTNSSDVCYAFMSTFLCPLGETCD